MQLIYDIYFIKFNILIIFSNSVRIFFNVSINGKDLHVDTTFLLILDSLKALPESFPQMYFPACFLAYIIIIINIIPLYSKN